MSIDQLKSGSYRVRIYMNGRVVKTATFQRMKDAKQFELAEKTAIATGSFRSKLEMQVTVEDQLRKWRRTKSFASGKYLQNVDWAMEKYLFPTFGSLTLAEVRTSDLEVWISELQNAKSPATARLVFNPLRQAYQMAERDGLISNNPCRFVRIKTPKPGAKRALTPAEIDSVVTSMTDERDQLIIKLAVRSGLRWGELSALQWRHLRDQGVLVEQAVGLGTDGKPTIKSTKTGESRFVPLPADIVSSLLTWKPVEAGEDDLIFKSAVGSFVDRSNWVDRRLKPACLSANVKPFTPHALRDTYATALGQMGYATPTIARLLGHSDPSVTLKHYQDFYPEDLTSAAESIGEVFSPPQSSDSHK